MKVAISGFNEINAGLLTRLKKEFEVYEASSIQELENYLRNQSLFSLPDLVVVRCDDIVRLDAIRAIKKQPLLKELIIVILSSNNGQEFFKAARELRINDLFILPVNEEQFIERINFLVRFQFMKPSIEKMQVDPDMVSYRMPLGKRLFDIAFSGILLLMISPILLVVALIIKFESKGPIIYKSKRTGTGYQVFDFFKFRSMSADADKKLEQLKELNQYQTEEGGSKGAAFMKIKNDPRITRFGSFIRNTSIDEIPQLFNILKGDMSVVGNRPLPLYEAEQLTSNDWSMRFAAPAGLTGLWQIKKRGTSDMSERERKKLDNFYAEKYSFWFDMKILFGTVSALLQKEKV